MYITPIAQSKWYIPAALSPPLPVSSISSPSLILWHFSLRKALSTALHSLPAGLIIPLLSFLYPNPGPRSCTTRTEAARGNTVSENRFIPVIIVISLSLSRYLWGPEPPHSAASTARLCPNAGIIPCSGGMHMERWAPHTQAQSKCLVSSIIY